MNKARDFREKLILKADDTERKKISFKYFELEEGAVWKPDKFDDEVMFYFLNGRGYIFGYMHMHSVALSWLFSQDKAFWLPRHCPFYMKNTGIGKIEIIAAYGKNAPERVCVTAPVEKRLQDCYKIHDRPHVLDVFWRASEIQNAGGENLFDFELNTFHQGFTQRRHLSPPGAEEFMYVIRGEGKIEVGDESFVVKPGSLVYVPPNVFHKVIREDEDDLFQYLTWIYLSENEDLEFPDWQVKAKSLRKHYFDY